MKHIAVTMPGRTRKIFVLRGSALLIMCLGIQASYCQNFELPINNISHMRMERAGVQMQGGVHAGARPIIASTADVSMVEGIGPDSALYYSNISAKLFSEHLIEFERPGLTLQADFLFDFSYGNELVNDFEPERTDNLFTNTRGFALSAKVGDAVYIYTDFRENQARFAGYLDNFVDSLDVVPGNGRIKPFGEGGFDYNMASGYVAISPTEWLHLQAGHSKQFIGHGQRSLLLSDNAFNLPFLKYTLRFWEGRVQYQYSLGLMQNLERLPLGDAPESVFKRKYMSWNYLSFRPIPSVEMGFFEAVMWKYFDEQTGSQPFNFNALNPLIFANSFLLGLDDPNNNAMVGINFAWQYWKPFRVYAQYMRSNNEPIRAGYQLGAKYFGLFDRIDFGLEYNQVDAFAYGSENRLQGFTHYNQPLAHPLGSGFREVLGTITYSHNRIFAKVEVMSAAFEREGRNPLLAPSDPDNFSVTEDVQFIDLQAAYIFNPRSNMQIYAGYTNRDESRLGASIQNDFWYFGLRTYLQNTYRNF